MSQPTRSALVDRAVAATEAPSVTGLSHAEYVEAILTAALGAPARPPADARGFAPGDYVHFHGVLHTVITPQQVKGRWKLRVIPGQFTVQEVEAMLVRPEGDGLHFIPGTTVFPAELDA